jgi:hypothetical protein
LTTKDYIEKFLKIKTKDMKVESFILNKPQMKLYNAIKTQAESGKPIRVIVLKARQMGFSTLTEALIFKNCATKKNFNAGIVAHELNATNNLFEMFKRYYANLPEALRPEMLKSNAKELVFNDKQGGGLDSRIQLFTAESRDGLGRSGTFNALHISEYAFWKEQKTTLTALLQTVPEEQGSIVIIESTANGFDEFKERWDKAVAGESEYIPVFCAWHELEEYTKEPPEDFVLTAEERSLKALYGLTDGQLYWRRTKIASTFNGDVDQFKQEYPASPEEAFISTGNCVFSKPLILQRLAEIRDVCPLKVGRFEYEKQHISREVAKISNIRWVDDENGEIEIYSLPEVNKNGGKKPYAIGGDTAGEGSDFFTAKVIDNITQKAVAVYRKQRTDDDLYADQMYCLGRYYNDAIIGIETNFSIAPTNELERLGYPKLYMREQIDDISKRLVKKYGFNTTRITRPQIIANFKALFRENPEVVCDKETLREMLTFITQEDGKESAMVGKHDDLVMATCIAHFVGKQGSFVWEDEKEEEEFDIVKAFGVQQESKVDGGFIEW